MNPLRCDEVKNSLIDYLEFELPLTRREHFYEHLTKCTSCQAMHNELQQVLTDAKKIDIIEPPQSYWDELPEAILKEVKSLRSSEPSAHIKEGNESSINKQVLSDDGKVIAFKPVKKHERPTKSIDDPGNRQDHNSLQVAPVSQVKSSNKSAAISWPKLALPIAAAVLVGIAAMFTFLEKEPAVLQDNIGFQAQIQSDHSLAQLAQEITPLSQPGNQFGFASQQVLFNGFSIGSMFSETKVYAMTGQLTSLKTHLALLKTALQNELDPQEDIIKGIGQLLHGLEDQAAISKAHQTLTHLLNEYALSVQAQDDRRYELVKAGAWLFDYALAALAKDDASIKQIIELSNMTKTLQASNAPPGVINSLNKIQGIAQQPTLTTREYQQILKEVENIRSLLG